MLSTKEGNILNMGNDRVLIIDDDPEIQNAYRLVLAPEPENRNSSRSKLAHLLPKDLTAEPPASPQFELDFAGQGPEGVALAAAAIEKNLPFAVAFIDIRMPPGFDGMETAARIRRIDPDMEIVVVTAYSDRSRDEIVGAVGRPEKLLFLRKPFDPEELLQMALSLTAKWNLARQAEERKNELETVLMTTPAAIFTVDANQCVTSWNPAAEQITGYAAAQVLGRPCILKRIGNTNACRNCAQEAAKPSKQHQEFQIVDYSGVPRTLLKNSTGVKDRQGRIIRVVEGFWDITARKAAEAALAESEARFRALVETTSDWVWETDANGRFTYCSPLCETIYGYRPDELVGQPLFDLLMHPEEIAEGWALFNQCVEAGQGFHNIERRSLTKDNRVIHIEFSGMPVVTEDGQVTGFRGIDRDITQRKKIETERRELEAQYRQSQKLEALGTLAGGIAHDLNNVLTPIMGGAQLSLLKLDPNHPIYDNLKTIEAGVQRAADLIHQILAFSRKQVMTTHPLNLTNLIKDFAVMLRRLIREDIHLTFALDDGLGIIEADKNQMEQILINLVVNAMDAVAEGGQIIIQTANQVISKHKTLHTDRRLFPGPYVVLSVSDNGSGMEPATIGRIFDPFFTTKENGRGTGLGLSTVYGIVKQHGGEIRVESAPGKGTRFDIFFRRTENRVATGESNESQTVSGGRETILLVEDNADVREVARTSLKHYGYRVIEAANGTEAIQVFKELEGRIDLLFTDVVMPAMGGQTLAESLRIQKPGLPVLFMSGHPFNVNTKKLAALEGNDFIQKPFKPLDLAQKIRRMLDGANGSL
jgi:two-component system, cell cycle sensor histidine kinase and response regulator CckA